LLTKMGLVGIKLKISIKEEIHRDFDLYIESQPKGETEIPGESQKESQSAGESQKESQSAGESQKESQSAGESQKESQSAGESQTNAENIPTDVEIKPESKDIINSEVKELAVNKSET
jgi:hypothetical protein